MTTTLRWFLASAGLLLIFAAPRSHGQDQRYRVIDAAAIGQRDRVPPVPFDGACDWVELPFGINNLGEAVFSVKVVEDPDRFHAFIWLPAPNYGLTQGAHDLHELAELGATDSSTVHDINIHGQIVGQVAASAAGLVGSSDDQQLWTAEAHVFELFEDNGMAAVNVIPLGALMAEDPGDPGVFEEGDWSVAYAINDSAVVVGLSEIPFRDCDCPQPQVLQQGDQVIRGFETAIVAGDHTGLAEILQDSDHAQTGARDVNNPGTTSCPSACDAVRQIAGWQDCQHDNCLSGDFCFDQTEPTVWCSDPLPIVLPQLELDNGSWAIGNNDAYQVVGVGKENCSAIDEGDIRGVFFECELGVYTVTALPPDDTKNFNRAEAINNPEPASDFIQIVGGSTNDCAEVNGLLWQRPVPTSAWEVVILDDRTTPCHDDWHILYGFDINDAGWIIAWGRQLSTGDDHALVLSPISGCPGDCTWDVDCDGDGATITDLLGLLAAWGPCSADPAEPCRADLDCNGSVGINDLLELLANWDACSLEPEQIPSNVQRCVDRIGYADPQALSACLCGYFGQHCD